MNETRQYDRYENSLANKRHDIAKEWNYEKNDGLEPEDVSYGSTKNVWWTCEECECEYQAVINYRCRGSSVCPHCKEEKTHSPKKVIPRKIKSESANSLRERYPNVADEWHPTKNGDLTPEKITYGSELRVWWQCREGHEWQEKILKRTKDKRSCFQCLKAKKIYEGSLEKNNPDVAKNWHPTKNKVSPSEMPCKARVIVWWKCKKGHEYQKMVSTQVARKICPLCPQEDLLLSEAYPQLIKEWHPNKNNGKNLDDYSKGTDKQFWWRCSKGHEWEAKISSRTLGKNCPFCAGKQLTDDNTLEALFPEIAKEWHPSKNGSLTPSSVPPGTNIKLWWLCSKGHEYQATGAGRTTSTKRTKCPICAGIKVIEETSLKAINPNVCKEWHPTKNGDLKPSEVSPNSHKVVWWKCSLGHEWEAQIYNRNIGSECPKCSLGRFSKISIEWLDKIAEHDGIFIQHAMNIGEHKIYLDSGSHIKVDGYCTHTNTVYQFHGCYWHFHPSETCGFNHNRQAHEVNQHNGIKNEELYQKTLETDHLIRKMGYNLITIWECDYVLGKK